MYLLVTRCVMGSCTSSMFDAEVTGCAVCLVVEAVLLVPIAIGVHYLQLQVLFRWDWSKWTSRAESSEVENEDGYEHAEDAAVVVRNVRKVVLHRSWPWFLLRHSIGLCCRKCSRRNEGPRKQTLGQKSTTDSTDDTQTDPGPLNVAVLHDVSMTVEQGECVGVVGGNGAGKSTLLRMVCGLTPASRGSVQVISAPPTDHQSQRSNSQITSNQEMSQPFLDEAAGSIPLRRLDRGTFSNDEDPSQHAMDSDSHHEEAPEHGETSVNVHQWGASYGVGYCPQSNQALWGGLTVMENLRLFMEMSAPVYRLRLRDLVAKETRS